MNNHTFIHAVLGATLAFTLAASATTALARRQHRRRQHHESVRHQRRPTADDGEPDDGEPDDGEHHRDDPPDDGHQHLDDDDRGPTTEGPTRRHHRRQWVHVPGRSVRRVHRRSTGTPRSRPDGRHRRRQGPGPQWARTSRSATCTTRATGGGRDGHVGPGDHKSVMFFHCRARPMISWA